MTTPIVNTHVHVPPNFSAFSTPEDVVESARAEGARAIGISNFYDQQVYRRFAELCRAAGLTRPLSADAIAADIAARTGVPVEWVSLQERHIARAVEEAITALPLHERPAVLAKAYGAPAKASLDDAVGMQGEVRSRLLKAGTPGFAPEVPLSFEAAYAYVLAMGGIPCYPTLADGVDPVCPFEEPAAQLAAALVERGIHLAELIPIRNSSAVVDTYVAAFLAAGIEVVAGTEHNTADRIPFDPACTDGAMSPTARAAFWRGTCIVVAHQARIAAGEAGYVDAQGVRAEGIEELVTEGAAIIGG